MKNSLIAAAIAVVTVPVLAQSSVTTFGVLDATYQHARQNGVSADRINGNGGNQFSRLGFRGVEDLGGGLSVGFVLDMGLNIDTGTGAPTSANNQTVVPAGGVAFNRRSTVSLISQSLGEIRVGRDFTPTYWNLTNFDPFGTAGAGSANNIIQSNLSQVSTVQTAIRASNSVGYLLPRLGGVYGQAMYALGENGTSAGNQEKDGNYAGLRIGYASGPFNVAIAHGTTTLFAGDVSTTNAGVSYDFGVVKPMAQYFQDRKEKVGQPNKSSGYLLGVNVNWGGGYFPISFTRIHNNAAIEKEANQVAVGYVHNLSKRTAIYTTLSRIENKGGAAVSGGGVTGAANMSWCAVDLGIRHSF